ncbi:MAG TPA: hypothetical protein VG097_07630, partial [Gemmata sp.]|nr:hypothetical protein [Gemmata sp.]
GASKTTVSSASPLHKSIEPPSSPETNDPIAILYKTKPKNVNRLIQQMGELLFGEYPNPAQAARIERFLHEPVTNAGANPPLTYYPPYSPTANFLSPITAGIAPASQSANIKLDGPLPTRPVAKSTSIELAPPPREVPPKPKSAVEYGLESPEFKARLREALHAMMCTPEYQLN